MRVVIATPLYPPEIGGPATYSKLLEEGLPKKDIEVTLVKFSEVRHLPRFVRHYAYYRRVLRALEGADAVLALDPVSVGLPALWAAKRARKPFFVKIVGDYAWEQGRQRFGVHEDLDAFVKKSNVPFPVRLLRSVQANVAGSALRIIVPSKYLKGIVESWGIREERIQIIYNAVPIEKVGEVPESVQKLPRPLVVTAGRLVPWKHIEGIIDAVSHVHTASLAVVGDGPLRTDLEHQANLKLPNRSVLTGLIPHADTLATIAIADVFVLNSSYEGLSHLLVEALALGTPIVATRVGGNSEVVEDGVTGALVPAHNPEALKEALIKMLSDDSSRAGMVEAAKFSAKRFSVDTMVSQTAVALGIYP
jgi:glycosyltransferase involved in cell wall biosynthesis